MAKIRFQEVKLKATNEFSDGDVIADEIIALKGDRNVEQSGTEMQKLKS